MLYTVQDTTMTALGDAIRSKSSQTKLVDEALDLPITIDLNTDTVNLDEWVLNSQDYYIKGEVIYINGASAFSITTSYQCESLGAHDVNVFFANTPIFEEMKRDYIVKDLTDARVENNVSKITNTKGYKYLHIRYQMSKQFINDTAILHSEILPLDANDEVMSSHKVEVKNTMTPAEMVDEINGLKISNISPIVLTDDCQYACSGPIASVYIDNSEDTITTNDITRASNMFYKYQNETIPFEINLKANTMILMGNMFGGSKIKELPKINNAYPSEITGLFVNAEYLRNIPEDYFNDWNWDRLHSYAYAGCNSVFQSCSSLRNIPTYFLNNWWTPATSEYSLWYSSAFQSCYALEAVNGLTASNTVNLTGNRFNYIVGSCSRLKSFTFKTNEDGTPVVVSWKSQTIDMTQNEIGYGFPLSLSINSGITADKEVKDDATYQALKNDPDWFTQDVNYSRYNHDSAVETINSLPDTSAYLASSGGTNTIKFEGQSGALTDGGAINTLTEEEIAVATSRGWTVSLV